MDEMNVDQVLLAFFGRADLTQNKDHMPLVIEKLKRLAPIAERKKKVLAFESTLSAEEHVKLLDAVGSDALKVYYDVENSRGKGYDIFHEMKLLGSKKLISEIHFKENGARLGEGRIDFVKVRDTLLDVGYEGWIIVEGSVTGDWKESQAANAQYVKKLIGR
jgi:sugar phosphate isomerase/epimerase